MRQRDDLQKVLASAIDEEEREVTERDAPHEIAGAAHDLTGVRVFRDARNRGLNVQPQSIA